MDRDHDLTANSYSTALQEAINLNTAITDDYKSLLLTVKTQISNLLVTLSREQDDTTDSTSDFGYKCPDEYMWFLDAEDDMDAETRDEYYAQYHKYLQSCKCRDAAYADILKIHQLIQTLQENISNS